MFVAAGIRILHFCVISGEEEHGNKIHACPEYQFTLIKDQIQVPVCNHIAASLVLKFRNLGDDGKNNSLYNSAQAFLCACTSVLSPVNHG